MTITRREFLTLSSTAAVAMAIGPRVTFGRRGREATFYRWSEIAPGLWCGQTRSADNPTVVGGNCLLVVGPEDALLIDTMQAALGPSLRREALAKTGKIARVINTHHHFDHAGGNAAFTSDTEVMAHPKCRERLLKDFKGQLAQIDQKILAIESLGIDGSKAAADDARKFRDGLATLKPDAFAPTKTIEGGLSSLKIAGRTLDVHHVGPGHTDNDLFIYIPVENVLVTGDLVFNGWHPYFDVSANASSTGWQTSLRDALTLCDEKTVVIPGHGEITDKNALVRQIEYFDRARAAVEAAIKEGKTREEIAQIMLPGYEDYKLKFASGSSLGGIFDELKK